MKICDVCGKTTDRLEAGPSEQPKLEVCGDCFHDLLKRFTAVERHLTDMRKHLRASVVEAWQRERKPAA